MKKSENPQKTAEKNCKTCEFCKQAYRLFGYYMKDFNRFFCESANDFTEPTNTCTAWQKKIKDPPDLSPARFDKAEEEVKAISELLKKIE